MEPERVRGAASTGGTRRGGVLAVPAAGSRGHAVKFALTAAAGLALAFGGVTGAQAAPATVAAAGRTAVAVHAYPRFEPCPCDHPVCRPLCYQGTLPATTAGTGGTDPKIPTLVGD